MPGRGLRTPVDRACGTMSVIVVYVFEVASSSWLSTRSVSTGCQGVLIAWEGTCGLYTLYISRAMAHFEGVGDVLRVSNKWDSYSEKIFLYFFGHQTTDLLLRFPFDGSCRSSLDSFESTSPIGLFAFTTRI